MSRPIEVTIGREYVFYRGCGDWRSGAVVLAVLAMIPAYGPVYRSLGSTGLSLSDFGAKTDTQQPRTFRRSKRKLDKLTNLKDLDLSRK